MFKLQREGRMTQRLLFGSSIVAIVPLEKIWENMTVVTPEL